ncbi:3-hydroxyacyl-CoA dehydrogenase family protein [Brevibacillus sp. DP1.3A]|uniref:3-hydroxyacyl-CoA dehydrogenase family protein n=1 Tax=Brevibacillus sp. DP1.3A TaxID=2738867 RepID=UPI00156AABF2|nr:3-hydroxyacyl-CoA dehydrogenase family protein [Brevibacillus sp. DP1.3A]UED72205.1 3-hydroxyacyl-CoA dehydrogenase family protein [Brevibacillus sp. DP1.3A]
MLQTFGVIGAGVMGTDIALDLAGYGYKVILKDLHEDLILRAKEKIRKEFRVYQLTQKHLKALTADELLSRIVFTTTYEGFEDVDYVIENVTEHWDTKKQVYNELRDVCREDVYYAVNTSCISITKVAALLPRPELVIGMHFMNPVPLKEMVEVIRGMHTSDETVAVAEKFLQSCRKTPVVVNDFPGFVTNRVLMLTINECIWAVQDGVSKPQDVDKIFRMGFGHKMGPLATGDLIGLDTILNSLYTLYEQFNDQKFRPAPLLVKMVDAGLLGRKTGKGFFEYTRKG